jgi:flagellar protein FliO/FliZ
MRTTPHLFMLVALLAGAGAHAQTERPFAAPVAAEPVVPPGIGNLGQVTFSLALVLAVIFVAAWLVRRMRTFGRPAANALEMLADLPVGQKERAVLIRVGKTQILLGVAPGRVSTLHVLSEPVEIDVASTPDAPGTPARSSFKSILLKSLGKS